MISLDPIKSFIADIARPYAIISISTATAASEIIIAFKVDGFEGAALFLGAAMTGVAGLYTAKSWENRGTSRHAADVEVAKASATGSTVSAAPITTEPAPTGEAITPETKP